MKRSAIAFASVLLLIFALLPATALAHHDAAAGDNPPAVNPDETTDATPPVNDDTDTTQTDTTQTDTTGSTDQTDTTSGSDTSSSCSGSSCSNDDPPCTEKCNETPCTANCDTDPPCVANCGTDDPCVDCIPDDDPCITDLNACGGDDEAVAGVGGGPNTAYLGARRGLPYTGIEDVLLPLLVGMLALIGGVVAYRWASVREALSSARDAARIRREERELNRTGYRNALRNIDADKVAQSFWQGRRSSAA